MPEIVEDGLTGFIVDSIDEAVAAVPLAEALDRRAIRRRFEERFSVERMANDYVALYSELLGQSSVNAVSSPMSAVSPRGTRRGLTCSRVRSQSELLPNLTQPDGALRVVAAEK